MECGYRAWFGERGPRAGARDVPLTPQLVRAAEFRETWRGYHPDDVDRFLEEVAVRLEELMGSSAPPRPWPTSKATSIPCS